MRIINVHGRVYEAGFGALGRFIDGLGSAADGLWPRRNWPPMVIPGGLSPGTPASHGPVRYVLQVGGEKG